MLVGARRRTPWHLGRLVSYVLRGRGRERAGRALRARPRPAEIACDRPLPLQADGEDLGDVERVLLEAERERVTLLA
jgi:hypothetical protein